MRILLTGATGYIGKRLLPVLARQGHFVYCCVRDPSRLEISDSISDNVEIIECDLLDRESLRDLPVAIDVAYYLVHSMSSTSEYEELERQCAVNFTDAIGHTEVKQVIYLGGMINDDELSKHLASRKRVEEILGEGRYHFTSLRAGIVIGSGSASFEIIRDLVEKLPIMVAPKWINTKCQPIGISDVITALVRTALNEQTFDRNFDIGGPDILTYKAMMMGFARVRGLKRRIISVPVMTPRLSSYWLYFVTSTTYTLAVALVNSMKVDVVSRNDDIHDILEITPLTYEAALRRAFDKIESNEIISSWKDSLISGRLDFRISDFLNVPKYGCYKDTQVTEVSDKDRTISNLWRIGGTNGWYHANFLWRVRGVMDKLVGGVGLRRGRTHPDHLFAGDALDFWRVLYANKEEGRLLLFAEMRLPGEAWLEFRIDKDKLVQTATFRPWGLLGRLYWYSVLPFHGIVFKGMARKIAA